jgi:hypothetical protein
MKVMFANYKKNKIVIRSNPIQTMQKKQSNRRRKNKEKETNRQNKGTKIAKKKEMKKKMQ